MRVVSEAAKIRSLAGVREPPYSTREIIEAWAPAAVVTGRELPPQVDELVTITADGPVILYRRDLPTPDQRIAIAHALGHLVFDMAAPELGCLPGHPGDDVAESRADRFALELLIPLVELRPYVRDPRRPTDAVGEAVWLDMVDEIASHFQVPAWAVSAQLGRLVSGSVSR